MSLHALVERWLDEATRLDGGVCRNVRANVMRECAAELLAALAGGGEAVAWMNADGETMNAETKRSNPALAEQRGYVTPLFTSAVAVQVDETMVANAQAAYADEHSKHDYRLSDCVRRSNCMRAALTAALNPGGSRE